MPTIIPYGLTFHSGLHIGTRGVNLEETAVAVPSDTLFAAIIDVWKRTGGDVDIFSKPFTTKPPDPPFLLTSAFPRAGALRFYPLPVDLERIFSSETLKERGKNIKRIRYFSEKLFIKALEGKRLDDELFPMDERENPQKGIALQGGTLWLTGEEVDLLPQGFRRRQAKWRSLRYLSVWVQDRVPRVSIDRITSASNIFHTGRISFADGCGLWFGVEWRHADAIVDQDNSISFADAFKQTLAILQDDGLGGVRTSGYGAFTYHVSKEPIALPDPQPGRPVYLLSRYHPRAAELPQALTGEGTAYNLTAVGGWLHSPEGASQRRKRLHLIVEGSLVAPPSHPAGDVADVRPTYQSAPDSPEKPGLPHPVYRFGLALASGWTLTEGGG